MDYRKCFVPTCNNDSTNSANKIIARIREDLREEWCRKVNVQYFKVYTQYCCEDHFDPKEDLTNYYHYRSKNQEPRLKPTAKLRNIAVDLLEEMTIRWGIVSAAKICNDFVNAMNSYPGKGDQVVAAIAARDRGRAEAFAKLHSIQTVFNSYQAMAESQGVVDVVYIAVLNPGHFALTKLFLENGKHVLCEKPLCLNLKQTQALVDLAKKKKLFLMEAVWSRFSPAYLALEKEINAGKLGDVKFVEVNFGIPMLSVDRLIKRDLGGSALMDIGVYTLQFAQFIFKEEPTKVTAVGILNDDGVDIIDHIILEYTGGRRAVLNVDITLKMWNKATVTGTKGRATVDEPLNFPWQMIHCDGTVEKFSVHSSKLPYNFGPQSAGLVYESMEVSRCIRECLLESPRMSHRESLMLARLEDTIRKQLGVHFNADDQESCCSVC